MEVEKLKNRLLEKKSDILNQITQNLAEAREREPRGDEGDQNQFAQEEAGFLVHQNRLRRQLLEIESALARIETGTFGICEITGEPIENHRLEIMPWTRFSIEGAELQEALQKQPSVRRA